MRRNKEQMERQTKAINDACDDLVRALYEESHSPEDFAGMMSFAICVLGWKSKGLLDEHFKGEIDTSLWLESVMRLMAEDWLNAEEYEGKSE